MQIAGKFGAIGILNSTSSRVGALCPALTRKAKWQWEEAGDAAAATLGTPGLWAGQSVAEGARRGCGR